MPSVKPQNRAYHRAGHVLMRRIGPQMVDRIRDLDIPEKDLTPLEQAARLWRQDILADLGGEENVSAAKAALLDASIGTFVVLHTIDAYLFGLGGGMVNKRSKKLFSVVMERMRVAETLTRQLQAIGLEKKKAPPVSLQSYVEQLDDGASE